MKSMHNGCGVSKTVYVLVLIGAINWGLVGLGMWFGGDWNIVGMIFGGVMWLEALIYVLVGAAAVAMLVGCKCKTCSAGELSDDMMADVEDEFE